MFAVLLLDTVVKKERLSMLLEGVGGWVHVVLLNLNYLESEKLHVISVWPDKDEA